jgi:hypothetical protein
LICCGDSSPETYSAGPRLASWASACRTSVDLPMPGSPPINTTDPGTTPPPSTRSSSPMPLEQRSSRAGATAVIGSGCRAAPPPRAARAPALGSTASRSSTSVFHSWQSGQRPSQRVCCAPQL